MEAKEFVKDCGMEVAKRTLDNAIGFGCSGIELFGGKYIFRTDDLKAIVDAWELVEFYGGIECAKNVDYGNIFPNNVVVSVKQAIKLVESCQ